jgi:uncharacterized UPF0146 family protein
MQQTLSLIVDQSILQSNVAIVKNHPETIEGRYFRNLSLDEYATFTPRDYRSLPLVIEEILKEKGVCKILEIGIGEAVAANEIKKLYGNQVQYCGLDIIEPKHRKAIEWINADFDTFNPRRGYDLIFSVNGLIYGYNDLANFFKYINALDENGRMFFNYDGLMNTLDVKKANRFHSFLDFSLLGTLYEAGMQGYCENRGGRRLYFGIRKNKEKLDPIEMIERADESNKKRGWSYIVHFGERIRWTSQESWREEISLTIKDHITQREKAMRWSPDRFEIQERNLMVSIISDPNGAMGTEVLQLKLPIKQYVDNWWHEHPSQKR